MLAAANEAASQINMSEMEQNIQASLQAKIEAGASRSEMLAEMNNEDLMSQVQMPVAAPAFTPQALIQSVKTPVVAPKAAVPQQAVSVVQNTAAAEAKASQEKVKEMAQKLGIPFTADLLALGSNSAISDALIEKAVAAGKTEAQINAAMASL
jgi:hypothetical protein